MKTRWGVCNIKDKVITLNTELLKKDMSLIDYVIVHEISHLYHPNHSKNFWNLVSTHYPYYKVARKMLKEV
jgi:predicted metal-dependent hydrolase